MKLFLVLLRSSWIESSLAVALSGISALSTIGIIALIFQILKQATPMLRDQVFYFGLLCIVIIVTNIASQVLLTRVSQRSISELLMDVSGRILRMPLRDFELLGPSAALATLTTDVGIIAMAVQGIPILCGNALTLFFGLAYLGYLSWPVLIGAVVFIVIGFFTYQKTASYALKYLRSGRGHQDRLMLHLRELVDGIKELKIHRDRQEEFLHHVLAETNQAVRSDQTIGHSIQSAAVSWGRLMFFIAIGALLSAWYWLPQSSSVTLNSTNPAALTGCVLTVLYLMTPLERIIAWIPLFERANVSIDKLRQLGTGVVQESHSALPNLNTDFKHLMIRDLCFAYDRSIDERGFSIGPIDLDFYPGEVVFLVGGNGSGKTTFMKLLIGLYEPTSGLIRIGSTEISDQNREAYRQCFSAVFAEPVLFENLLGVSAIGPSDLQSHERQVADLLSHLELTGVVRVTDGRFSSIDLSKGQRKRLALLTAYLEDRPIYVFDEWAADQDPLYKSVFYREILPRLQGDGKSVIVISHDDQYFSLADRIIKLEAGRVVGIDRGMPKTSASDFAEALSKQ